MMIGNERSPQTSKPPPPASPAALPLSASRRRFSRVGRKHSNGSVQSSSSSGTARSTESVGIRQPAKNKIRRHQHHLSAVFGRGPRGGSGEMAAAGEEALVTDDPSELSNHITAPGILKIFGTEICEGANYKSVLATTRSSARELVKEALARYSLSKEDADDYVLCDVIGCVGNQCWRTECVRVVGDHEKPLLLQSLWKPREGFARRFEIQRKATVEENNSKDQDTVTAGINAQARKLQKTRCRGKSVPLDVCVSDDAVDGRHNLFKSLSDTDLTAEAQSTCTERTQEEDPEAEAEADKATQCPANEREETESSDDSATQYSIHPPLDFPYFLLLQGFSYRQDFVINALINSCTVFGRHVEQPHNETESDGDRMNLWAPDLLPDHCSVTRASAAGRSGTETRLKPLNRAKVKRNGAVIKHEVELQSGDIIALGDHYLFMYKDPTCPKVATPAEVAQMSRRPPLCKSCVRARACFRDVDGAELLLPYDVEHESMVLKEIFSLVERDPAAHKLTAAFLLCLCLQQSAAHFSMPALRRLLLQMASELQTIVWEKAKELAALQPEISESDAADWPSGADRLIQGLEPLVLWMSNSVQILHFIHQEVPRLLHGVSQEEEEEEEDCIAVLELRLSSVRSASEEAMTVLEEVLMFTFQQCVYYLTKMLYPFLPGVLDSHAFSDSGQLQVSSQVRRVLDVCSQSLRLLRAFDVHPDISAQLFSYLFFFINALLFNLLMERGSGGAFYCWSRGVQVRANLDLLMDWAHGAGLADLAHTYLLKLSSAVNLLATPKENLLQMSWKALRMEFPSLNAAQLHHILREYEPRRSCPAGWTPSGDEDEALATADILESFDQHPPLILPADGFILQLRRAISETQLITQLYRFQRFITDPEAAPHSPQPPQLVPMEAKLTKMELHPKAHLEVGHTEMVIPHAGASDLGSCEALLTKKLQNLELQDKDAARPALDPSCLLTPPNTPQNLELTDSDTDSQQHTSTVRPEEGESEESEIREEDVFVLELQRAACGLGLMLADGEESPSTVSGIYIKSVLPDSPAALSQRLRAGDRILAVNGLSLVGVDYQTGRDLIQMSGERPRLLVARSHSATKETRTKTSA
ncbi:ras-associating and dilute domain-containing protein [Sinocyclocheilus anshuiensis]|uniref:ras-associating and dilute domain-containing protein n=1 Tax=Sinocyclocheilus anshuiensis TaxID=1608454 RepID=UPI0007BA902B|nr:PREDICTED: ras-associating and dilute domain-containing protein-like [Sinocyclocheilus anshuiensis]